MAARREGWLGNLLAEGPKQLAEAIGGDAPKWAVHTKGGTPAHAWWRPMLGQMLRELVASGGMNPREAALLNHLPICVTEKIGVPRLRTIPMAGRGPMCCLSSIASSPVSLAAVGSPR